MYAVTSDNMHIANKQGHLCVEICKYPWSYTHFLSVNDMPSGEAEF